MDCVLTLLDDRVVFPAANLLESQGCARALSTVAAVKTSQPQAAGAPVMPSDSKRTGVLALKVHLLVELSMKTPSSNFLRWVFQVGMLGLYDKWGQKVDCTVLHIDNCQVTTLRTNFVIP